MPYAPRVRHLIRARDLVDARFSECIGVDDMARAASMSRAHFSREFRKAFGESPHGYLLTRRLERAAALLRNTDRSVTDICLSVGLQSVGSFTTSFTRTYGRYPDRVPGGVPAGVAAGDGAGLRGARVCAAAERTFGEDSLRLSSPSMTRVPIERGGQR